MTKQKWDELVKEASVKWCVDNQFSSKDRGNSFCEGADFVTQNLEHHPRVQALVSALEVCANRKECKAYECCASCGPIYEAEEALAEFRSGK